MKQARGFTLIEMLVAMTIFTILLGVMGSFTGQIQQSVGLVSSKVSAERSALEVIQQLDQDLQGRVRVPGAHFYWGKETGNDSLAFYTKRPGFEGKRSASWIHYRVQPESTERPSSLERGVSGLDYEVGSPEVRTFPVSNSQSFESFPETIAPANYQSLSTQVLRFETAAMWLDSQGNSQDPKMKLSGDPPLKTDNSLDVESLRAMVITIVTLDAKLVRTLTATQKKAIAGQFKDAESTTIASQNGSGTLAAIWSAKAEKFKELAAATSIPISTARALRVYERICWCSP